MIEKVSKSVEVFLLNNKSDINPVADAIMSGKIVLLRVGSVFSFTFNPNIEGLDDKFNFLKERENIQTMSFACTFEQAAQIVDKNRVNEDFFRLSPYLCSRLITRIPVDAEIIKRFPSNTKDGTLQFISFEDTNPLRDALREELYKRGCEYLSITSGNIHGAPTIEDFESAKMLAALFNIKTSFLGMNDIQTVAVDIPSDNGGHKGSYIILSFCNPNAIEVKRLANKKDRDVTEKSLREMFANVKLQTPFIYDL